MGDDVGGSAVEVLADVGGEIRRGGEEDESAGGCAADLEGAVGVGQHGGYGLLTLDELDACSGDDGAERIGDGAADDDGVGCESKAEKDDERGKQRLRGRWTAHGRKHERDSSVPPRERG